MKNNKLNLITFMLIIFSFSSILEAKVLTLKNSSTSTTTRAVTGSSEIDESKIDDFSGNFTEYVDPVTRSFKYKRRDLTIPGKNGLDLNIELRNGEFIAGITTNSIKSIRTGQDNYYKYYNYMKFSLKDGRVMNYDYKTDKLYEYIGAEKVEYKREDFSIEELDENRYIISYKNGMKEYLNDYTENVYEENGETIIVDEYFKDHGIDKIREDYLEDRFGNRITYMYGEYDYLEEYEEEKEDDDGETYTVTLERTVKRKRVFKIIDTWGNEIIFIRPRSYKNQKRIYMQIKSKVVTETGLELGYNSNYIKYDYNEAGKIWQIISDENQKTVMKYNADGNIYRIEYPTGRNVEIYYIKHKDYYDLVSELRVYDGETLIKKKSYNASGTYYDMLEKREAGENYTYTTVVTEEDRKKIYIIDSAGSIKSIEIRDINDQLKRKIINYYPKEELLYKDRPINYDLKTSQEVYYYNEDGSQSRMVKTEYSYDNKRNLTSVTNDEGLVTEYVDRLY